MLELNKIHCGNNLDLIKEIDSNSVDLIWYSPPYFNVHKYSNDPREIGFGQTLGEYLNSLIELTKDSARILKDSGNLVINIMDLVRNNEPLLLSDELIYGFRKAGINLILRQKIVWSIRNEMPVASQRRFVNKFEWILHWSKTKDYYFDVDSVREPHSKYAEQDKRKWKWNSKGKNPGNIIDIPAYRVSGKNKVHIAGFPIQLCDFVTKSFCPETGVVCDLFAGSGTSCVSAKKLNRKFIGLELDQNYCNLANERINGILI